MLDEKVLLSELTSNKEYAKKVLPHLKTEYFESVENQHIFSIIKKHVLKYRKLPSLTAIAVMVDSLNNVNETIYANIMENLEEMKTHKSGEDSLEWFIDETEKFCLFRSVQVALDKSIDISLNIKDGEERKIYSIKNVIDDALKVNFNRDIGIEYFNDKDIEERWNSYNEKKIKYKTHIKKLNWLTGGGFEPKKLHVFFGDTHVGKTMTLASLAAGFISNGYNVLYVTLEMSKEDISKLIDANYTDIKINDIATQDKSTYIKKIKEMKQKTNGRLFVHEFPTGNAGTNHIRVLLEDLRYKKNFIPHIIIVDYINLMRCDRYSDGNSYTLVKGISEELRGLGVEGEYCVVSATQTNRGGAKSSDIDMTDTAESYGLPQTVDLLIGMMSSDTLKEENLLIWKSLKNRLYGIVNYRFPVRTMFEYARLIDCDKDHDEILQNQEQTKNLMEKSANLDKLKKLKVNINNNKNAAEDLFD